MNEKFIKLLERQLNNENSREESTEFFNMIDNDETLKNEYEEQKRIKEVLSKMNLSNPSKEIWDHYWMNIYNRIERKLAWILVIIGSTIMLGFVALQVVEQLFADNKAPILVKYGIFIFIFGLLVLLFSVIREKFASAKEDKYKEIQR